ncbi:MAG: hypothetical protein IH969_08985 [Candidatus Krumholzibacteriota bacterium]|nr:hypothetical protein [Candidatus Krumholzibacteriota bacterium]
MRQEELDELLEYSTTLPTGTTIGKRWKRRVQVLQSLPRRNPCTVEFSEPAVWHMGEYAEHPDPGKTAILWYEIVIDTVPLPFDAKV